jgi:predicted DNA-binding protein
MQHRAKTKRLSIRVTLDIDSKLRKRSAVTGKSESLIIREALETHLAGTAPQETALELAKRLGLIGKAKHLPSDLSTNPTHLEEFAKPK